MNANTLLAELKEFTAGSTIHMYIIERKLKIGAKAKDKASEKFEYHPLKVNMSEDLVPKITDMLKKVIEKKVKEDAQIMNYTVIDDSEDKIQTYSDLGKIAGFETFLENLGGEIRTIESFNEVADLEKAWALCYGFEHPNNDTWMYCIKKLAPRNLAVDKTLSEDLGSAVKNAVNSFFDTKTSQLKPLEGFALNIEPSIDMIYLDKIIYIFNKKGFEDVTSLTDEFIAFGKTLVEEVNEIQFVSSGIEFFASLVEKKPSYRKKLIKAKEIGNLEFLKSCNIKTEFTRAGKKIAFKFSYDEVGKVVAKNEKEAEKIIEVLSEYFKEGILAGKVFETASGRVKKQ